MVPGMPETGGFKGKVVHGVKSTVKFWQSGVTTDFQDMYQLITGYSSWDLSQGEPTYLHLRGSELVSLLRSSSWLKGHNSLL